MTFRAIRLASLFLTLILISSCRGRHSRQEVKNEEPQTGPSVFSTLKMSDQAAAGQLLKGFHSLESGTWRWTAGSFQVLLRPPLAAAQKGATLSFAFSIPEVVLQKLSSMTLTASLGATKLKSETYSNPGAYTFLADVPASLLAAETVTIDFAFDKSLAAGTVDQRELGVVATAVGLESK